MPPIVATIICLGIVVFLFRRDFREPTSATGAIWLPFFWVVISGSRFISGWLAVFGVNLGPISVEEGSPIDAFFFIILIGSGVVILLRRGVSYAEFARNNRWVTIYLLYCLLAIAWSDFPYVAFKRWIKLFGQPVMVLLLLTEPDPLESLTRLMKRCAYFLIPISILFVKYYPQWGRGFDTWTGSPSNTGITTNKNALGCDCLILGLFFIWHFLRVRRQERGVARRQELYLCGFFFLMIGWLFYNAHSSTSTGSFLLAAAVLVSLGFKFVDRRRIGVYLMVVLGIAALAEIFLGFHNYVIEALGRNPTLTGRTEIWGILLNWNINPILGVGFETFWLGERVAQIENLIPGLFLNEAHNGYLETYINLGLLGLAITIILLFATYFKAHRALLEDFDFGRYRLAYLAAFIAYNWTEAAFRTHSVPFFMFFLIAIDYTARPRLEPNA